MEIRLGLWRLSKDYAMPAEATSAFHRLVDVLGEPRDLGEVLDDDNGWEVASHTLTPDDDHYLLSVVFVRYPT